MYLQLFLILATSASIMSKRSPGGPYTCYECQASGCSSPYNKTCDGALSCYTSIYVASKKYLLNQKGCIRYEFVRLSICNYKNFLTQVTNCCEGHFCNADEFPSIPDHWTPSPKVENKQLDTEKTNSTHVDFLVFVLLVIIALILSFIAYRIIVSNNKSNLLPRCYDKHTLHTSSDSIVASGSRSTTLALNQHCMAHDVTLIECKDIAEQLAKIGQGRFGEVTKGAFHGENAAITITRIRDEASWQNEVHVCTNIALYYENVLCFKGSAFTTRNDSTEIWLLTASHEQGSLYVYLLENTVTVNETVEFVRSICSGLLHLHAEMFGSKGKPAIAHRDLKHLTALAILLKEYWHKIPEVRPTVCRVKEALDKINADMEKLESVV